MKNNYPNLMSPTYVGKHRIKNRIIAAPVTLHSASNGENYPTEYAMSFFEQRARAGAGIVVCAGVKLLPVEDDGIHAAWDLYKPNAMHRLAEMAERIHFYGAKASMELIGIFEDGYVASDGGLLMDGETQGREIPISEMMKYKDGYVNAAQQLVNLGYDGILLHFGHNIPIAQFLSPLTNKRTDQYGGSFENRMRYLVEILKAIREKVGDKLFIDIRMSVDEFKEGGITIQEGIKMAKVFSRYADIIQASCGMINPELMCRTHPCDFLPPNPNVYLSKAIKDSGEIDSYVAAIGAIGSLEDGERFIKDGTADFIAMSRALISDPELIPRSVEGHPEDVVPCIKCMRCHDSTVYGNYFQCSVNPTIGIMNKMDKMIKPVKELKKVGVIGGGPAGMVSAITASDRGHDVTLFEESDTLGGTLKFATKVDFKYSLAKYRDYLINQTLNSKVKVKLNTKVKTEDIEEENFDSLILALGAEPIVPKIPGIEKAVLATKSYDMENKLGKKVVVIGGGQVGCETGLHLSKLGKEVSIIEMRDALAPDASKTHRDDILTEMKKEKNLKTLLNSTCIEIKNNKLIYSYDEEKQEIFVDSVILAAGMKPRKRESIKFDFIADETYVIGDASNPRTVEMAVREGYFTGINL
jgi:2,4-dienoyl-CoA reductase-like NADH-dependent reductase (Old Yellow Enzyme family)/thioredoxin reductase